MRKFLIIICTLILGINTYASHIPGGNLTYQCTGNPNEYIITMTLFVSCPSSLGTQYSVTGNNNCGLASQTITLPQLGTEQEVSQICPEQQSQSDCNTGGAGGIPGVMMYTYQTTVTLPAGCDSWTFDFELCCRDASTNTDGGSGNSMYFETVMNSLTSPCDASPYVTAQPIPYVCAGVTQTYCPGAIDPDGDSLSYTLVNPMGANGVIITHPTPYSPTQPLQGLTFDPITGCITFNQPTTGNFVVTYLIEAWDNNGNMTGSIIHDFQFEVINNANCAPPTGPAGGLSNITGPAVQLSPNTIEICEGQNVCFDVEFTDPDPNDTLLIDTSNTNVLASLPGATLTQTGTNPTTITVCWNIPPGANPNSQVTIGITDGSCPIENLASFPVIINVINSTVSSSDTTICGTQSAQLSASGGSVFNWQTLSGDPINVGVNFSCNPCANPIASPNQTTTYLVTSNLSGGCVSEDTITVNVVPDFSITSYGDTLLCDYLPHQIGVNVNPAGAGYNASWTPTATLTNPNTLTPTTNVTETTTYTTVVTSPLGCTKIDSVTVTLNPPPNVVLVPGDTNICIGESIQFDVSLTSLTENFDPIDPSLWSSIQGDNTTLSSGCGAANATGDALFFNGSGLRELVTNQMAVSSCTSIDFCLWIGNSISTSQGTGCENADNNEDVELNYSINGGATWIPIQTFIQSDWDAGGIYANSWACFSIPIPAGALTANTMFQWTQPSHSGAVDNWAIDNISLNCGGNSNYTYLWDQPNSLSDSAINNPIASPTTTTTYTVTLTDTAGCSVDRTQTITVTDFAITTTPNDTSVCPGSMVNLNITPTVPGAYTYAWEPAAIMSNPAIANPTSTHNTIGLDTVYVGVGIGNCIKYDTILISVSTPSNPNLLLNQVSCNGLSDGNIYITPNFSPGSEVQNFTISDSISGTVLQVGNDLSAGMTDSIIGLPAGAYTILLTDSTGCTSDTTVWITEPTPVTINTITNDTIICINGTKSINATAIDGNGAPYTYNWTDLSTNTPIAGNGPHNVSPIISPTCYSVWAQDALGCISDTQQVCVSLFPNIVANTSNIDTTICPTTTVDIDMNAIGGSGQGYNYDWYENGNLIGNGSVFNVEPTSSSTTYIGVATDNCTTPSDSVTITVDWFALPTPLIAKDKQDTCYNMDVEFTNTSIPAALIGTSEWTIDGITTFGNTTSHLFTAPVCKDVSLKVTTIDGCIVDTTYYNYVCPHPYPVANFYMTPPITDMFNTEIEFTNLSTGDGLTYFWDFGSGLTPSTSTSENPMHIYPEVETGTYPVVLITTNQYGCADTAYGNVIVNSPFLLYVPNTFTPDGDGLNEIFRPYGDGIDFTQYTMEIYDRWGVLIYQTDNPALGWDGTYKGNPAPIDTYVWKIIAKEEHGTIIHDNFGHVNLVR